jgi:hypothetical protein
MHLYRQRSFPQILRPTLRFRKPLRQILHDSQRIPNLRPPSSNSGAFPAGENLRIWLLDYSRYNGILISSKAMPWNFKNSQGRKDREE